ncbi:IS3 family transposase [Bacteroides sp. 224]|uniref:IS3 family transposase n=1 Tax=Bacteroides sp. 224 TaxID=2302936 RepID=UPI0013D7D4F9|nr:IS3 family transposase [Bacteroides sp. 224]NDV66645.1 IS3 family transposase [Bacteroides sp. 224]
MVSQRNLKVALACRLFGHCRQAFYQSKADIESEMRRNRVILDAVHEIRNEDPGIGGYKLWIMLTMLFGEKFMPGRDSFYMLLRRHHLMLPVRKARCTTNSNHRYRKWKNLIKGFVPTAAGQLWVSDITYISLHGGNICYLHLITDAYSHKIVGWVLADTLRAAITVEALLQAIKQATSIRGNEDLSGLIHHSDRGVQYCCDQYVGVLQKYKIGVSMTEDYKPTDNAIAERINGIIKVETVYRRERFNDIEHARNVIGRYIHFYNYRRPHMSIGYKIPAVVHLENGIQKKMWKKKKYLPKCDNKEEDTIPLQDRTTSQGEGVCRQT